MSGPEDLPRDEALLLDLRAIIETLQSARADDRATRLAIAAEATNLTESFGPLDAAWGEIASLAVDKTVTYNELVAASPYHGSIIDVTEMREPVEVEEPVLLSIISDTEVSLFNHKLSFKGEELYLLNRLLMGNEPQTLKGLRGNYYRGASRTHFFSQVVRRLGVRFNHHTHRKLFIDELVAGLLAVRLWEGLHVVDRRYQVDDLSSEPGPEELAYHPENPVSVRVLFTVPAAEAPAGGGAAAGPEDDRAREEEDEADHETYDAIIAEVRRMAPAGATSDREVQRVARAVSKLFGVTANVVQDALIIDRLSEVITDASWVEGDSVAEQARILTGRIDSLIRASLNSPTEANRITRPELILLGLHLRLPLSSESFRRMRITTYDARGAYVQLRENSSEAGWSLENLCAYFHVGLEELETIYEAAVAKIHRQNYLPS